MNNKNSTLIKRLSIILAVQIVILIFVNVFSFSSLKTRQVSKELFKGLNKQNIASFEINDSIDGFKAVLQDKKWFIEYEGAKLPADADKIKDYLDILGNLSDGFVTYTGSDEKSDAAYGLDQKVVQNLTIKNNKSKEFKLQIGSVGSRRGTTYIRKDGENRVRQIDSNLKAMSTALYKDWTDRRIVTGKTVSDLKSIRFDLNLDFFKSDYTIMSGTDNVYSVIPESENRELDQLIVKGLVNSLLTLKSDNFKISGNLDGKSRVGNIQLEFKTGTQILEFYPADGDDIGNFIVKTENSPYLFLFHKDTLEKMLKTKDGLYKI